MAEFIRVAVDCGKNFYDVEGVKANGFLERMKQLGILAALMVALVALGPLAGCSRSGLGGSAGHDGRITGSPADPPFAFTGQWARSNRYIFHSEITTSADVPRQ